MLIMLVIVCGLKSKLLLNSQSRIVEFYDRIFAKYVQNWILVIDHWPFWKARFIDQCYTFLYYGLF